MLYISYIFHYRPPPFLMCRIPKKHVHSSLMVLHLNTLYSVALIFPLKKNIPADCLMSKYILPIFSETKYKSEAPWLFILN